MSPEARRWMLLAVPVILTIVLVPRGAGMVRGVQVAPPSVERHRRPPRSSPQPAASPVAHLLAAA